MIKFNRIIIDNFFSISHIDLKINAGVFELIGENSDIDSEEIISNGAGKTSLVNAVFQGLYNKNRKDLTGNISGVNNQVTGLPYKIHIEFLKGTTPYIVINDRATNSIKVIEDGVDISTKGIKGNLALVKNIIGFDFNTFSSIVFLNQDSLNNILDITSKENIVYQFFNIAQIKTLEASTKALVKELKEEIRFQQIKIDSYNKSIALVDTIDFSEEELLRGSVITLVESLSALEHSKLQKGITLQYNQMNELITQQTEINTKLRVVANDISTYKNLLKDFSSGSCPVCNSDVSHKKSSLEKPLMELKEGYSVIAEQLTDVKKQLAAKTSSYNLSNQTMIKRKANLKTKLNTVKTKLLALKEARTRFDSISANIVDIRASLLESELLLKDLDSRLIYFNAVLGVIKSGTLVNNYLDKYVKLLNLNIKNTLSLSSFKFIVNVTVGKGKLVYNINEGGSVKTFNQLSSGERTRVSLTLLLATLKTIEQLSDVEINILTLDEILGNLDADGVGFLKEILSGLRKKKMINIIAHHNEIEQSFFNGQLLLKKKGGLTTLKEI
jgi:DNA repair exonuclease SbcCD ATPase subunit